MIAGHPWVDWVRIATALYGALTIGELFAVYGLSKSGLLRAPRAYLVFMSTAHASAVAFMVVTECRAIGTPFAWWPTPAVLAVFTLSHAALVMLIRDLRTRARRRP